MPTRPKLPGRFIMVWLDGAADEPQPSLDGRTPLEFAATPHCDAVCAAGRQGTIRSIPADQFAQPDLALVRLAGYDPRTGYDGIGPFEAAAIKLRPAVDETVFRCDLVTVADGILMDANAGDIGTQQAALLIQHLNETMDALGARFQCGEDNHHLLLLRDAGETRLTLPPTYEMDRQSIMDQLPRGRTGDRLREIIRVAGERLAVHPVNTVRRDLGENPANGVWLWGGGRLPRWKRFHSRFGVQGALVGTTRFARGLAATLGWTLVPHSGENDATTVSAALAALYEHELVVVHVPEPAESTLRGDVPGKVAAIEAADRDLIGPLREHLRRLERHRLLVASTLTGRVAARRFSHEPAPFCMSGTWVEPDGRGAGFGESAARSAGMHVEVGSDMMEYFLRG